MQSLVERERGDAMMNGRNIILSIIVGGFLHAYTLDTFESKSFLDRASQEKPVQQYLKWFQAEDGKSIMPLIADVEEWEFIHASGLNHLNGFRDSLKISVLQEFGKLSDLQKSFVLNFSNDPLSVIPEDWWEKALRGSEADWESINHALRLAHFQTVSLFPEDKRHIVHRVLMKRYLEAFKKKFGRTAHVDRYGKPYYCHPFLHSQDYRYQTPNCLMSDESASGKKSLEALYQLFVKADKGNPPVRFGLFVKYIHFLSLFNEWAATEIHNNLDFLKRNDAEGQTWDSLFHSDWTQHSRMTELLPTFVKLYEEYPKEMDIFLHGGSMDEWVDVHTREERYLQRYKAIKSFDQYQGERLISENRKPEEQVEAFVRDFVLKHISQ